MRLDGRTTPLSNIHLAAGNNAASTPSSAPFRVTTDGKLWSTSGSIGGWYIGETYLSNRDGNTSSGTYKDTKITMYSNSNPGGNFLEISPTNSSILSIRADSKTGINIYTQSTSGKCLTMSAQTGSIAIDAAGGSDWYQRSGETWNMPGVLCIYYYISSLTWVWGNGASVSGVIRNGTGTYNVTIGRLNNSTSDYMPIILPYNNFAGSFCITSKTSASTFTFTARDTDGKLHDAQFMIILLGRNQLL